MNNATRDSTKTKYKSIINKWNNHCRAEGLSTTATTDTFVNFLAREFTGRSLSYKYIRGYTAALAEFTHNVNQATVQKIMKGMHNIRPPKPKYCVIWDVNEVLNYLGAMRTDSLMLLSQKLTTLMMLLSGNRVNMLTHMRIDHMVISDKECSFTFPEPLKHTKPGSRPDLIRFRSYEDEHLCPVRTAKLYVEARAELCGDPHLFITTTRPHRKAHHDTLARWIKNILCCAGIDTNTYQAHSCRAASSSTAGLAGVSVDTILKSASWSNVGTFRRFYNKEIVNSAEQENFGLRILEQYKNNVE